MSPSDGIIVSNSFEEIVFSNRNRAYGAYILRKKEKKYLLLAFLISLFMVISITIIPLLTNYLKGGGPERTLQTFVIANLDTSLNVKPPEPPKLNLEEQANRERFITPVIVDSAKNNDNLLADMGDLLDNSTIEDPPPVIEAVAQTDKEIERDDPPVLVVEEPATFEGGDLNSFNKWVNENIKYPQLAIENGISGKVYIQFVVNGKGRVTDVKVLRGADPALDQEAVRVIESSPLWTPPKQGGRPVKQLFSLPVIFRISNQ